MAITASIALSPATATRNLNVNAALTVNNSAAGPVQILAITPSVVATSGGLSSSTPVNFSAPILPGGQLYTVPGTGSVVVNFGLNALAPAGPSDGFPSTQASEVYTVGAMVYTGDGAVTIASTANLTVNAPAYPGTTTTA
jgi:hypothetical protein